MQSDKDELYNLRRIQAGVWPILRCILQLQTKNRKETKRSLWAQILQ